MSKTMRLAIFLGLGAVTGACLALGIIILAGA